MTLKDIAAIALDEDIVQDAAPSTSGSTQSNATQPTDLQKHDAKYHPKGYKQGDACKYREMLAKGDNVDQIDPENINDDTAIAKLTGKDFANAMGKVAPLLKLLKTMPAGSQAATLMKKQIDDLLKKRGIAPTATPQPAQAPAQPAGWQNALNRLQGKNPALGKAYGAIGAWLGSAPASAPASQPQPTPAPAPAALSGTQQNPPKFLPSAKTLIGNVYVPQNAPAAFAQYFQFSPGGRILGPNYSYTLQEDSTGNFCLCVGRPGSTQSFSDAKVASQNAPYVKGFTKSAGQVEGIDVVLYTPIGGSNAPAPTPSPAPAAPATPPPPSPQPATPAPPPPPKPKRQRKPKTPPVPALDLGKGALMQDGDDGATLNKKRVAAGLKPLQLLANIDAKVKACTQNYQAATKQLAANFNDPDLDISAQADFDTVQKNWANTIKRLVNQSAVVTATKAHRLLQMLNAGGFKTKYASDSLKQERYDTLFGLKHGTSQEIQESADEAPLSATLCSTDSNRMFQNKAFGTFGIIGVEWKKDSSNYAMAFANCDIGTPGDLESNGGAGGYGRSFNPTLVSDPSITALAAFDNGTDSGDFRLARRLSKTGELTPSGKYMSSYCAAIKKLRKGEIQGDALDFDIAVNRANMSPWRKKGSPPRAFGWNEVLLCGKAEIGDIGALHFNTKAWADQYAEEEKRIASGIWPSGESRPTQGEKDANVYIQNLVKSHGAMLKQRGIKVVVDGKEMQF